MIKVRVMPPDLTWDWTEAEPGTQGWHVHAATGMLVTGLQYPVDKHGDVVGAGDIVAQTDLVFSKLEELLRAAWTDWAHVVRINTCYRYGDDVDQTEYWERMTQVRDRYALNPGGHSGTGVAVFGLPHADMLIAASLMAVLS